MKIYYDPSRFAQCRTCGDPMCGILSIAAREDCHECGGVALYVLNKNPSTLEDLVKRHGKNRYQRYGERL